jgi:hypothetical protein
MNVWNDGRVAAPGLDVEAYLGDDQVMGTKVDVPAGESRWGSLRVQPAEVSGMSRGELKFVRPFRLRAIWRGEEVARWPEEIRPEA